MTLYSFTGGDDGYSPCAALVQGTDGNFYGTTQYGGTNDVEYEGDGTIFRITTNGTLATLVSFAGTNGAFPVTALVQGTDGNFYGTAQYGGPAFDRMTNQGYGTVFRMTSTGTLTMLYSFTGGHDGGGPSGLVQGMDGNFCGTTAYGGYDSYGTIYSFSMQQPPVFQTLTNAGGVLTLGWSAVPGLTYQVQYTTNISQTNWDNLGGPVPATNGTMSTSDSLGAGLSQRWYRVALLP